MALPVLPAKESKKKSRLFSVSEKQPGTERTGKIRYVLRFGGKTTTETDKTDRKRKKKPPERLFREAGRTVFPYFVPAGRKERAPTTGPSSTPKLFSKMEYLNKIEIRGIVGTAALNRVGDSQVCRFSVATEYAYKDRENNPVVDTTWFNVTAWEGRNMPDLQKIVRGAIVQVGGRLRTFKFTSPDGTERNGWEIQARRISLLEADDDPVQPQKFL